MAAQRPTGDSHLISIFIIVGKVAVAVEEVKKKKIRTIIQVLIYPIPK